MSDNVIKFPSVDQPISASRAKRVEDVGYILFNDIDLAGTEAEITSDLAAAVNKGLARTFEYDPDQVATVFARYADMMPAPKHPTIDNVSHEKLVKLALFEISDALARVMRRGPVSGRAIIEAVAIWMTQIGLCETKVAKMLGDYADALTTKQGSEGDE